MIFLARLRQGIGIDIEYNEDICHRVDSDEAGKEEVWCFAGMIIMLPFVKIYIGDFFSE